MNAFILIVPLLLVRYLLLGSISKKALKRAAHYPKMNKSEQIASSIYQLTNIILVIYPLFLTIKTDTPLFYLGLAIYIIGIVFLIMATVNFAKPSTSGINTNGIYKLSRNPMYVAYFIIFLGCTILSNSIIMLVTLVVFQITAHWLIIAEERWCHQEYATEYLDYTKKVRRYF